MSVWGEGSRSVPAATVPDARRVRPTAKTLSAQQRAVLTALRASTTGPMTCEDLVVALGEGTSEKGIALTLGALIRRGGLVRWSWVYRGSGGRPRKGYSAVPES